MFSSGKNNSKCSFCITRCNKSQALIIFRWVLSNFTQVLKNTGYSCRCQALRNNVTKQERTEKRRSQTAEGWEEAPPFFLYPIPILWVILLRKALGICHLSKFAQSTVQFLHKFLLRLIYSWLIDYQNEILAKLHFCLYFHQIPAKRFAFIQAH